MKKGLFFLLCLGYCTLTQGFFFKAVKAQSITSDGTLPTPTEVTENGNISEITGGTARGGNLFHSFGNFSVDAGRTANFLNADSISNILSRVTGGNISNIDGLIRANNANLFLINPAGIIFGPGARLDIGGSFYGSSADSILFEDGEFSATDLDNPPLLTINAPIGLNFRDDPQPITNGSRVQNDEGVLVGLEVSPGETFALLGGEVNFTGGVINAPGANVFIGGLSELGVISLDENLNPSFPDNLARADVTLTNGGRVDVRAGGGGSITVEAGNLELSGGESGISFLATGIAADSSSPDAQAGDININATDTITVQGSIIANQVAATGVGNAGDIKITTANLELSEGGSVGADNGGQAMQGQLILPLQGTLALMVKVQMVF